MKAEVESKQRLVVAKGIVKINLEDDMPEYTAIYRKSTRKK